MVRLHVVVEGQTEEVTIRRVIAPHLGMHSVYADARSVETSRSRNRIFRGGLIDYSKARGDLERWMKEDTATDCYFTTMFDFYALPDDFPGMEKARSISDPYLKIETVEKAFAEDIDHPRFIPYLQLHEFEALILADPQQLDWEFLNHESAIRQLIRMAEGFESPELIDDTPDAAPSKRIIRAIPEYAGLKTLIGPIVVEKIGLEALCEKCSHFRVWLEQLRDLSHL